MKYSYAVNVYVGKLCFEVDFNNHGKIGYNELPTRPTDTKNLSVSKVSHGSAVLSHLRRDSRSASVSLLLSFVRVSAFWQMVSGSIVTQI